jgi:hypothetical protein
MSGICKNINRICPSMTRNHSSQAAEIHVSKVESGINSIEPKST